MTDGKCTAGSRRRRASLVFLAFVVFDRNGAQRCQEVAQLSPPQWTQMLPSMCITAKDTIATNMLTVSMAIIITAITTRAARLRIPTAPTILCTPTILTTHSTTWDNEQRQRQAR